MQGRIETFVEKGPPLNEANSLVFLNDVMRFGKGRFAQRLASKTNPDICPTYLKDAINSIVKVLSHEHQPS